MQQIQRYYQGCHFRWPSLSLPLAAQGSGHMVPVASGHTALLLHAPTHDVQDMVRGSVRIRSNLEPKSESAERSVARVTTLSANICLADSLPCADHRAAGTTTSSAFCYYEARTRYARTSGHDSALPCLVGKDSHNSRS